MLHGDYHCLPPNKCGLLNDPLITCVIYEELATAGLAKYDPHPNDLLQQPIWDIIGTIND
jgi:hypothetical protein